MILLIGATGHVGVHVARSLAWRGEPFRALLRDPAKASTLPPAAQIARGDITDSASLESAMQGVERVMLITPSSPNHVELEARIIAAARKTGVKRVVKLSAIAAALDSPVRFLRQHAEAEKLLEESGLEWTHLRPNFFMQNLLSLAPMVKSGAIYYDTGEGKASFVDLVDVGAVAAAALTTADTAYRIFDITGPYTISYHDIAGTLSRMLAKPVRYEPISHETMRQQLLKLGIPPWHADGIVELDVEMERGKMSGVTDAVEVLLMRAPRTLDVFLRDHLPIFAA